jgi:glycosyltransferase involved in cell wall biosynthesis
MIDVIIPVYNDAKRVCRAIRSAESALGLGHIIVIDDGSTDETRQVILNTWKTIRLTSIVNSGPSIARNTGVELSNAKYVMFLDSDDEILMDNVTRTLSTITSKPKDFYYHSSRATPIEKSIMHTNTVAISDVIVRRELLTSTGLFDSKLWQHEDWDLWSRCIVESPTIVRIKNPLSVVHLSPLSNSSNYLNMAITNLEVLRRNASRFKNNDFSIDVNHIFNVRFRHLLHDVVHTRKSQLLKIRSSYITIIAICASHYIYNKFRIAK